MHRVRSERCIWTTSAASRCVNTRPPPARRAGRRHASKSRSSVPHMLLSASTYWRAVSAWRKGMALAH
eukprot:scaffold7121_cov121-Isochrysis_galbana.AAC.11